jgi:hypothetical protein
MQRARVEHAQRDAATLGQAAQQLPVALAADHVQPEVGPRERFEPVGHAGQLSEVGRQDRQRVAPRCVEDDAGRSGHELQVLGVTAEQRLVDLEAGRPGRDQVAHLVGQRPGQRLGQRLAAAVVGVARQTGAGHGPRDQALDQLTLGDFPRRLEVPHQKGAPPSDGPGDLDLPVVEVGVEPAQQAARLQAVEVLGEVGQRAVPAHHAVGDDVDEGTTLLRDDDGGHLVDRVVDLALAGEAALVSAQRGAHLLIERALGHLRKRAVVERANHASPPLSCRRRRFSAARSASSRSRSTSPWSVKIMLSAMARCPASSPIRRCISWQTRR